MTIMNNEINYLLENDKIEGSNNPWGSPCILVKKPDLSFCFCTDFRRVNAVTKSNAYLLPRIDNSIDQLGKVNYCK